MYKLNFALVLIAVFATAQGGKEQKEIWKKLEECSEAHGVSKDDLWEGKDTENFWCSTEKMQEMSDCFLLKFDAWDGEHLNSAPAKEKYENDPDELAKILECFEEAEKFEKHLQPCKLIDCCKDRKLGMKKSKKSKRSVFFLN